METVRAIIKHRDGASDREVDELLDEFRQRVGDGEDPEEAMHEVFGLEPDYLFEDAEVNRAMGRGFRDNDADE